MLDLVLENFRSLGRPIVIMQARHVDRYCADSLIRGLAADAEIIQVDGMTEGAACTVARRRVADRQRQRADPRELRQRWSTPTSARSVARMRELEADGGILTFARRQPEVSYARVDASGPRRRGGREAVISDQATVGIYYFRRGADFVRAAREMIRKDDRGERRVLRLSRLQRAHRRGRKRVHPRDRGLRDARPSARRRIWRRTSRIRPR